MKIDYGPGYRVYFLRCGDKIVVLLCGGDKSRQASDIKRAKKLAKEIRAVALKTTSWDIQDHLKTSARQMGYLRAALEDGDPGIVAAALGDIAKARGGMTSVAESTGITREGLYKALSRKGDPRLSTFLSVTRALGLEIKIAKRKQPRDKVA